MGCARVETCHAHRYVSPTVDLEACGLVDAWCGVNRREVVRPVGLAICLELPADVDSVP